MTASTIGFFHFVDPDQDSLRLQAWSSNTVASLCQAEGKGRHYPVALAGLWAQGLRDGRPFVCNDFAAAIGKRGMPAGHVQIHRLVAVPVAGEGGFAAIIGVGNKAEDYDDDDVSILGELAAMAMDIVNRVRAEELRRHLADELARVAQQWSAALESFQGGIAVLDRDHGLLRANAAFYTLTGARGAELSSQATAFLSPLLVSGGGDMVLEAGDPANPSGRPLEVRVAPLGDGAGAVDGLVVSLYDLTHAREQERRLEQMVGELTSSNAELERFGQVAAHDLQEPTRRQVLFAQMLQRRLDAHLDEESRQYLGFLINDALKMRDMVRALNVYHHAGQTLQPAEMVDLDRVAADVLGTLAAEVDASGARFCLSPLGEVVGERARLHLLLVNLLSNALKFRHPQRVPRIHLGREAVEDGLGLFRVADNGVGIPEQYRAGLFSLFRRLSPDQGGRSSGMGLAQCRRIVEDMGGRIWVEGNDQGGTTVKFTLPQGRKQTAFNRTQAATSGH